MTPTTTMINITVPTTTPPTAPSVMPVSDPGGPDSSDAL